MGAAKYGISDATFYNWRSCYGGMEVSDARKLNALEDENRRLKKLLAETMLMHRRCRRCSEKNLTPGLRKCAVTWAIREKNYSQRRACGLVGLHPKTYRYATKRSGDEEHRRRLRELASQRRRFGYRRLGLMLERQGIKLNRKKLYRLYKEERLSVRKRGGRKRALGTRAPMVIPQGPQSALVARLRDRYVCEWPTLPYPHAGRRLHQRVPGPGSGHLSHRSTCRARARSHR